MNGLAEHNEPTRGAKINVRRWNSVKDEPAWVTKGRRQKWNEPGLVVWDRERGQIVRLHPRHALDLLDRLRTTTDWQQDGTTIGEPVTQYIPGTPPFEGPTTLTNTMAVTPQQAEELAQLLQSYEGELQELAEAQDQEMRDAFRKVYDMLLRSARAEEVAAVDLSTRPLPWVYDPDAKVWICNDPPNRGTISVANFGLFFQAWVERPHEIKRERPALKTFEAALTWVEQELIAAAREAVQGTVTPTKSPRLSLTNLKSEHRERLAPFWIDPQSLEPAQVSYRAVMYIEHEATKWYTMELSFGEQRRYPIDHPTPLQLAQRLHLDANHVTVTRLIGGFFRITSLLKYASSTVAFEQARSIWKQSSIAAAMKSKTILSAAYGVMEDETGYEQWEAWEGEWPGIQESRETQMAEWAFKLTLIHALDVAGYRAHLGFSERLVSDAKLLRDMHEERASFTVYPRLSTR